MDAPPPKLPSLARVRNDALWDYKGKGRTSTLSGTPLAGASGLGGALTATPQAITDDSEMRTTFDETATSKPSHRVGALGIPISDDEDEEEEEQEVLPEGLQGEEEDVRQKETVHLTRPHHASSSPAQRPSPFLPPPATYSRGGSTRSGGGSTRDVETGDFRDIVDDLTRQNQELKARLRHLEAARCPSELKADRLFEIRWHDKLSKPRRREIEAFLTGYVQSLSGSADGSPSASSSSRALASESLDPTSAIDYSEATSSLGADLRSLRSSEKETLKNRAAGKERRARSKGSSGGSGAARCGEVRNGDAVVDSPLHPRDPPAILRRPTDIFPPDLDYLAAPSFSGAEPRSLTGTGAGMRISDPSSKRRKRRRSDEPSGRDETPLPPSMSYRNTMAREDISDPDKLEATIVEWVERVFFDALPVEGGGDDVEFETSTNTAYLRALLTSDETLQQGGWLYVNLIATFASLQRLNVTVTLIRHALRRSKLVELSEDGAKIRWRGPSTKPAVEAGEAGGCAFEMDGNNVESMQLSSRRRESGNGPEYQSNRSSSGGRSRTLVRRGLSSLDDDTTATGGSTVPTSQHASDQPKLGGSSNQRSEEQDASHTRSSHPRPRPSPTKPSLTSSHSSSSLQPFTLTLRTPPEPLGSVPASTKHLYKPLIFRPLSSPSSDGSIAGEAVSEGSVTDEDGGVRPAKRSRTQEGGVLFFANDLFFSDLAGDSYQRVREAVAQKEDEGEEGYESILGESTTTHDAAPSRSSGLREGSFEEEVAMEVEPWELPSFPEPAGGAVDKLDAMGEWSEIEELVVFDSPSPPVDGDEYHPLLDLPLSHLRVSGMSDVTAADHFSLRIKLLHPSSAASSAPPPNSSPRSRPPLLPPTLLSSHIIHHHPSICPRFPRVRMRFSSTSSDADSEDQPQPSDLSPTLSDVLRAEREHGDGLVGDYLTSLALPMPWAPGRQYSDSDEQGSGALEEDEQEELVVL